MRGRLAEQSGHAARASRGYGYIGLLALLAVTSTAAALSLQAGARMQRAAAEQALLDIGEDVRRALDSYRAATPVGQRTSPAALSDLLRDPRYPSVRRHLRRLPADPITGTMDWGIVRGPDGGIAALHSLSEAGPLKHANFAAGWQTLEGKARYRDWEFTASLPAIPCHAGSSQQHYNAACSPPRIISPPPIPPSRPALLPSTSAVTAKPAMRSTGG